MSGIIQEFIRCFLCRKKNCSDKLHKSIDATQCPASKKSIRTVLLHLARLGKFELHLSSGEWLCRKCYVQIADYDSNLVNVTRKQRNLSMMVEKAATSFESDIEEECIQEMSNMAELNDDHFFEDANVSDRSFLMVLNKHSRTSDILKPQYSSKDIESLDGNRFYFGNVASKFLIA